MFWKIHLTITLFIQMATLKMIIANNYTLQQECCLQNVFY